MRYWRYSHYLLYRF